ncbi:MAG TPA: DUF1080 domain-containing protein, partial [Acidobacteriota bacterium]
MRKLLSYLTVTLIILLFATTLKASPDTTSVEGRWDITVYDSGNAIPSWLEIVHSGTHTLVGQFVGPGGS